ncbi:MAG: hypothetical protein K2H20_00660 [Bacilli bacterium]|nr:hypothetical protein [Bacilli bacterium]
MASWDFTVDSEKQMDIADKLSTAADDFDTKVSLLYGQIDSMNGTSWIGEDYTAFNEGTHNYEGALKDLSNGFRMFGEHFKLMSSGTDTLATELIAIIQNMTGTNTAGNSNGDSTSSSSNYGNDDPLLYRDSTWGDDYESDSNSSSPSMSYGADEESTHESDSYENKYSESDTNPSTSYDTADVDSSNDVIKNDINTQSDTISSGQEVTINGEKCYFLMRNSSGTDFYVRGTESNSQVMVLDESGKLIPYDSPALGEIVSRDEFVDYNKRNLDYYWKVTYNNGTSPYDSIGTYVDSSFTSKVANPNQELVQFSEDYLNANAVTLDEFDRGAYSLGKVDELPAVIKIAPGQKIFYNKPMSMNDREFAGGENGIYIVYDSTKDAYFALKDGAYKTGNDGNLVPYITSEQLLSDRTSITK